ncbi:MAG TPA: hypothetical protein DCS07_05015, partial [Bdellovibrionales bacterium]|nr:hypothetical protein [Bdellovibrionales bacterium]
MKRIIYLVLILALPALPGTAFAKNLFCNEIGSTDLMWEKTKQNFSTQGYSIPKNPATFAISNFDSKKPMLVGNAGNEELARKGDYFFEATPVGNINLYRWYRLDAN